MKQVLVFILLFSSAYIKGEDLNLPVDSTPKPKKFQFNGIYLNGGLFITPSVHMNRRQLNNTWPEFSKRPYSNYNESDYSGSGYTGTSCYEVGASFYTNFLKKDSLFNRWQMQIGINYFTEQSTISSFENYTAVRLDTLRSVSGGQDYYVDRFYYNSVYVTHSCDFIGLNICETYGGDNKKFASFNVGFGLSGMFGINPRVHENSGVWTGTFVTQDSLYDYNTNKPLATGTKTDPFYSYSERNYSSSSTYSSFLIYLTAGANFRWFTSKKGICAILSPSVKAGIKDLWISRAGSFDNAFFLPSLSLRVVFN